jgi:hypothetical protein
MEDDATGDVATVLKAVRGWKAQEFDSALLPPNFNSNADVMELVYVSDLKSEFCGFESHHPHQN